MVKGEAGDSSRVSLGKIRAKDLICIRTRLQSHKRQGSRQRGMPEQINNAVNAVHANNAPDV